MISRAVTLTLERGQKVTRNIRKWHSGDWWISDVIIELAHWPSPASFGKGVEWCGTKKKPTRTNQRHCARYEIRAPVNYWPNLGCAWLVMSSSWLLNDRMEINHGPYFFSSRRVGWSVLEMNISAMGDCFDKFSSSWNSGIPIQCRRISRVKFRIGEKKNSEPSSRVVWCVVQIWIGRHEGW